MFSKKDLKNGDIVTYRNRNRNKKIIVNNELYDEIGYSGNILVDYKEDLTDINNEEGFDIVKIERPIKYETIYVRKEILDKQEKEYLSAVIRPFKNKVKYIMKILYVSNDEEYIRIYLDKCYYYITLPNFKKGTMYRGMNLNKKYTLEELGL